MPHRATVGLCSTAEVEVKIYSFRNWSGFVFTGPPCIFDKWPNGERVLKDGIIKKYNAYETQLSLNPKLKVSQSIKLHFLRIPMTVAN